MTLAILPSHDSALTLLRAKLEGKKKRECWSCKGFRHLAQNCRNKEGKEKRGTAPQNKFEVLSSRVMQYDVKKRMIRKQKMVKVEYFKCGEKGHKYRECSLWKGKKKLQMVEEAACVAMPQKVQQKEWRRSPAHVLQQKVQKYCGEVLWEPWVGKGFHNIRTSNLKTSKHTIK